MENLRDSSIKVVRQTAKTIRDGSKVSGTLEGGSIPTTKADFIGNALLSIFTSLAEIQDKKKTIKTKRNLQNSTMPHSVHSKDEENMYLILQLLQSP